jgi:aconitate hydratase
MGVLPLNFYEGTDRRTLGLDGSETIDILGLAAGLKPRMQLTLKITRADGSSQDVPVLCRVDTLDEVDYFKNGGILQYVLRSLLAVSEAAGRA